jgi:hypothetical protein
LQTRAANQIQSKTLSHLITLVTRLGNQAGKGKEDYQNLINKLEAIFEQLSSDWEEFPPGKQENGRPDWQYCKAPPAGDAKDNWEIIYTDDPFTVQFTRLRHSVSLQSLVEMIRPGKQRLESLSNEHKRSLEIIHSLTLMDNPSGSGSVDPDNPDFVHKTFRWKFKPKGSGVEIDQSISLDISHTRFEHYRRLPRFSGEWNRYVEEEMPEIRCLAMEFQKLHAVQKWSTYNQAFDILMFVQSSILYSNDLDTTGYQDWARYPIETLMEGTGDCEDVAILCASIIARLGFQTVLLVYPSHVALGVAGADRLKGDYIKDSHTGKRYFYGEATSNGWHLGEIPKSYNGIEPTSILPVNILIADDQ